MGNTSRLWRRRRSPDRRLVLVTGEGSHQLTAQEISQFGRRGLKPIVFVLNNSGYLIEPPASHGSKKRKVVLVHRARQHEYRHC